MTASLAGRSLRSPGDPSCAFAPLLDPGRTDVTLPWRSHRCCPRLSQQRRLRTMSISGLTHAASAPAVLRFAFRISTHAQGWLPAGWLASTGRVSNPLDHYERFPVTWPSSSPVLLTLWVRLQFHERDRRAQRAGARYDQAVTPAWSIAAKFDGEFAHGSQTYAGTGTL